MIEEGSDYSKYPGHPLYGFPKKALDAARDAYLEAFKDGSTRDPDMIEPVADAVVSAALQEWDRTPIGDSTEPAPMPRSTSNWIEVRIGDQVMNTGTTVNGPLNLDSQPDRLMLRAMLYAWLSREDDPDDV
jgi:hypothetical protein